MKGMKIWKMKKIKIMVVILVVLSLVGLTTKLIIGASSQGEASTQQEDQIWTVQRGNLSVDITAAGNLALAKTEDLAFDIPSAFKVSSSNPISVQEVLIEEGDSVQEGQVLVKLDTTAWNKQLNELEKALTTAKRNLTSKESALTKAERQVTAKELAVSQAQYSVQAAENDLKKKDAVKAAFDAVDRLTFDLRVAMAAEEGSEMVNHLVKAIAEAKEDLKTTLQKYSSTVDASDDAALEAAKSLLQLQQAKMDLEDAQIAAQDAQTAVADAQLDKEDAEQAVTDAQSDLDEAKSLSPIIKATFSGFVTKVNVKGGDQILKGTVAVQIADPDKFEAEILVSELDIAQVELGGDASITLDSMSGLILPAKVTHISPTATIQSGVVNYKVTVEVQSTPIDLVQPPVASDNTTMMPPPSASDNVTMTPPTGIQNATEQGAAINRVPAAVTKNLQLREGLTVAVTLIVAQRQNVLLVPYTAITTERGQKYVQVVSSIGATEKTAITTEKRAIKTGITDYQYTEVTEGLSEGEQIVVPQSAKTTMTTTQQQQPGGMMMIPGMGGPPSGGR